ncbi:hypothetical protein [Kosakonia sp. MUSA4]|uniref:hypothetical protein n=1 Tax=Kosakonia sp. MUSA4 TaxID=2067958 RepID=UPI001598B65F|nr:hypothetical protein [Kosakonia sp. MUSA4]QJT82317.1 hypothetical protein C0557_20665 [Kosakonia sp. MUSA4]
MHNKKRKYKHQSSFWMYLKSCGCYRIKRGKFTDVYGDISFNTEAGRRLRIPASVNFHGQVRITQANKLSPNITFFNEFHILPLAIGTIDTHKAPRLCIPESTRFMSGVFLNTFHGRWPESIHTIKGHFFWTYSYIRKLPEVFSVHEDMNLSGSEIKQFPKELTVRRDAIMPGIQTRGLPDRMNLSQSLRLSFSTPEVLPAGLRIPGDLSIKNTRINQLPDGLCVGGNLNIAGTSISLIPETEFIGGEIFRD